MTDFTCQVCGEEEHNEARYWRGHTMCIDCYDAMMKFEVEDKEQKQIEFYNKHKGDIE